MGEGSNRAHKNFWIYVLIVAAFAFGMIYVSSITQHNEELESQQLETELTEHKKEAKGIELSVREMSEEIESLNGQLKEKETEVESMAKSIQNTQKLISYVSAYVNGKYDVCNALQGQIDETLLTVEEKDLYHLVAEKIKEIKE